MTQGFGPSFLFEDLYFFAGIESNCNRSTANTYRLPLRLYTGEHGIVAAEQSSTLNSALTEAYRAGSMLSSPPGETPYAASRTAEVLEYLQYALGNVKGKRILEIGCGPGETLIKLSKLGAAVTGCDPGPSSFKARSFGVDIINKTFEPTLFQTSSYDAVISWMLLEHLADPIEALQGMLSLLRPGGTVIAAVPNCEPLLRCGDPNLLAHQHLWYFTPSTIERAFLAAGLKEIKVSHSRRTLSLICCGSTTGSYKPSYPDYDASLIGFKKLFDERMNRLQIRIAELQGKTLGWVGISIAAANLMSLLDVNDIDLRLFELDPNKINKRFLDTKYTIESDISIIEKLPQEIWVLPYLMGPQIVEKISKNVPASTKVIAVQNL